MKSTNNCQCKRLTGPVAMMLCSPEARSWHLKDSGFCLIANMSMIVTKGDIKRQKKTYPHLSNWYKQQNMSALSCLY